MAWLMGLGLDPRGRVWLSLEFAVDEEKGAFTWLLEEAWLVQRIGF